MRPVIYFVMSVLLYEIIGLCCEVQAQQWQWLGPDSVEVDHVYAKGDTIYVGTPEFLHRSVDGGGTWIVVDSSLGRGQVVSLAVDPKNPKVLYVVKGAGIHYTGGLLYRSLDAGTTWALLSDTAGHKLEAVRYVGVSPHNSRVVFATDRTGFAGQLNDLYRSTDGGKSWTFVGGDFAYSSHGVEIEIAFDPVDSLKIYATGNTQFDIRFYVSSDGGARWRAVSFCNAQRILPTSTGRIFLYPSIYWSDNEGLSWTSVDTAQYPWDQWRPWHMVLDPHNDSMLFAAGRYPSNAVRKSKDQGKTWEVLSGSEAMNFSYTSNYSLFNVELLSIDPVLKSLYVGTNGQGLYRYDRVVSVQHETELPSAFHLDQNFPNPFNPTTTIEYTIRQKASVKLFVYDILGKEVNVLVDRPQEAGSYSVRFDAKGLPSGVYYYRLTAGRYSQVKKMIVLR